MPDEGQERTTYIAHGKVGGASDQHEISLFMRGGTIFCHHRAGVVRTGSESGQSFRRWSGSTQYRFHFRGQRLSWEFTDYAHVSYRKLAIGAVGEDLAVCPS